jgi:hypothetical protein
MPLIGLRPTKARLVMEESRDSVLVMKVVLDDDEAVELATGGALNDLGGVLRIRERKSNGNGGIGSVVYVASGADERSAPAKFQVNVGLSPDKFATLMRAANSGRLPAKFIVNAGASKGPEAKAFVYRMRAGVRVKGWNNDVFRKLPVTNFVMILPMEAVTTTTPAVISDPAAPTAAATNAQVAELMDDMLIFQSDTRTTIFGLVSVIGVVAIAALVIGIGVYFR